MKNNIIRLVLFIVIIQGAFSQDQKEQKSKMLDFVSKTGVIIKFEDYNLPNIKSILYNVVETRIRKIVSGNEEQFFLQVSQKGTNNTKIGSIAYEDLLEVLKALSILNTQSKLDLSNTSDYLENKFITEDGFEIGYYINKGKIKWTMQGNNNTIFAKNYETLLDAFQLAKKRIEELK